MACPTSPGAATPANARRWTQRPEGANRGDSGAGDRIGRLDLPTPERVKRAVAEGRGGSPCSLTLPLRHPAPGDPIARLALPPPEREKRAVAEVRGGSRCCLSLPLGHPGGNLLTAA